MRIKIIALAIASFFFSVPAFAQAPVIPCVSVVAGGCTAVNLANPLPVAALGYGVGVTPIAGNGAGTTGAVVGTLTSVAGQTAYICGFNVQGLGTANSVGPVVIAGLIGSSQTYQSSTLATGVVQQISQIFQPCIPASAVNTNITITTTAAAGGTAVNVNSWGYRQ